MVSLSKSRSILLVLICGLIPFFSCQDSVVLVEVGNPVDSGGDDPIDDSEDDDPVDDSRDRNRDFFIVDRTGRRWDVTHAVRNYGFDPEGFQFGLGVHAIPPILSPGMICKGEPGYPTAERARMLVMGVDLNGFQRAYPMRVLAEHEVVDEVFGETHVAVAY